MNTMTFTFDTPIEVAHKGDMISCSYIEFVAPKANQRKKTTKLKQMFFQAITAAATPSAEQKSGNADKSDIKGYELLIIMAQSHVDYTDFIETGRSVVCDGVGKLDGVEPFTAPIADNLDADVLENIIGDYVANFILRSALKSATRT